MKLVGSATEKKIRETLVSSSSYIFCNVSVVEFLGRMFGSLSSAYVVSHTPDQDEDFYVVLVNGSVVVKFELSRNKDNAEPKNFSTIAVDQYYRNLRGRHSQLKFAIAMELAEKDK